VTTLAGSSDGFVDGTGTGAKFSSPNGVAVIPSSGIIVVADKNNNRIRRLDPTSGVVTTLAGNSYGFADGAGAAAAFKFPNGVAVIPSSSVIIVADTNSNRIRLVTPM
jgi:sugar lactone lactonase YvrE